MVSIYALLKEARSIENKVSSFENSELNDVIKEKVEHYSKLLDEGEAKYWNLKRNSSIVAVPSVSFGFAGFGYMLSNNFESGLWAVVVGAVSAIAAASITACYKMILERKVFDALETIELHKNALLETRKTTWHKIDEVNMKYCLDMEGIYEKDANSEDGASFENKSGDEILSEKEFKDYLSPDKGINYRLGLDACNGNLDGKPNKN